MCSWFCLPLEKEPTLCQRLHLSRPVALLAKVLGEAVTPLEDCAQGLSAPVPRGGQNRRNSLELTPARSPAGGFPPKSSSVSSTSARRTTDDGAACEGCKLQLPSCPMRLGGGLSNLNKSMAVHMVAIRMAAFCWVSTFFFIPFIYCGSCRLQYKTTGTALNNPLKTKNQDTNGETYAENNCSSLVLLKVSVFLSSFTRGNKTKQKKRHRVDNPLFTALYFHSNRGMFTVAYCGVIFFSITQYERKPRVCALSSSTVSNSGVVAVLGPERHQLPCACRLCCQSWKFRSPKAVLSGPGRPTSFPGWLFESSFQKI